MNHCEAHFPPPDPQLGLETKKGYCKYDLHVQAHLDEYACISASQTLNQFPARFDCSIHNELYLCNHRHAAALAELSLNIEYIASVYILLLVLLLLAFESQPALVLILLVSNNFGFVERCREWVERQYLLSFREFWQLCASRGNSNERLCLGFVWRRRFTLFIKVRFYILDLVPCLMSML